MSKHTGRYALIGVTAALAFGVGAYYAYNQWRPLPLFDPPLAAAIAAIQSPRSYEALVETSTRVSDRDIRVIGLYSVDFASERFRSVATTTIVIPDTEPPIHEFSLENVSIGSQAYVRIRTESVLLRQTIPHTEEWQHFSRGSIPDRFTDIAIVGPISDNLAILQERGRFLTPYDGPYEILIDDEPYSLYRLSLSPYATERRGGILETLVGRIGAGMVEVGLKGGEIRHLRFVGDDFVSTTSVRSFNTPLPIEAPAAVD